VGTNDARKSHFIVTHSKSILEGVTRGRIGGKRIQQGKFEFEWVYFEFERECIDFSRPQASQIYLSGHFDLNNNAHA
jgi:hypothetical protein